MTTRLKHVLAILDLSVPGIHAAWRAARIARENAATLHLLEPLNGLDNRPVSRWGPSSPVARSRSDLAYLAAEIAMALGVKVTHSVCAEGGTRSATRLARTADLVVLAHTRRRGVAGWFQGALAERVLREAGAAVLTVQRPSGVNYRCTLAAGDPSLGTERLRDAAVRVGASAVAWVSTAGEGDAVQRLLNREREDAAALIVIEKTGQPWWIDRIKGSLAADLGRRARCDVLWLPAAMSGGAATGLRHLPAQ